MLARDGSGMSMMQKIVMRSKRFTRAVREIDETTAIYGALAVF